MRRRSEKRKEGNKGDKRQVKVKETGQDIKGLVEKDGKCES